MRISVKQSGGYAGTSQEVASLDTAGADPATEQRVRQALQGVGFYDLPAMVSGEAIGADFIRYEITVTEGDREHTVAFVDDDTTQTEPLRSLVAAIRELSQR